MEGYLSSRRTSAEATAIQDGISLGSSALQAFERAAAAARARQNTYLGIEHLLLGILAEDHGEAADLLASVDIDRRRMSQIIQEEIQ